MFQISGFYLDQKLVDLFDKLTAVPNVQAGQVAAGMNVALGQLTNCRTIQTAKDLTSFVEAVEHFKENETEKG
jgi:hypothetical protein